MNAEQLKINAEQLKENLRENRIKHGIDYAITYSVTGELRLMCGEIWHHQIRTEANKLGLVFADVFIYNRFEDQTRKEWVNICKNRGIYRGFKMGSSSDVIKSSPRYMTEVFSARTTFGDGDCTAIHRHSRRFYLTEQGVILILDRNLSTDPRYYEVHLMQIGYQGILPNLTIEGRIQFGEGKSWPWAEATLEDALGAKIVTFNELLKRTTVQENDWKFVEQSLSP